MDVFWKNIDPTDPGGQFVDRGGQYRSAIFYHSEDQKRLCRNVKQKLAASGSFINPLLRRSSLQPLFIRQRTIIRITTRRIRSDTSFTA